MRIAGFVMTLMGLISFVISVYGVTIADKGVGTGVGDIIFFKNSWFPIMFIFWFGAGISVLLTFPKEDKKQQKY